MRFIKKKLKITNFYQIKYKTTLIFNNTPLK